MGDKSWTDIYGEMLATLHPTQIRWMVETAVHQIISDYEDYLEECLYDSEEGRERHEKLLAKWKDVLKLVQSKP